MSQSQRTIKNEITLSGIGLHTGSKVTVQLKPSPENTGVNFRRVDLAGKPVIKAGIENLVADSGLPRCTSIGKDGAVIHTIEHLMGVLCGLGIDNIVVDVDGKEMPGLDGSGINYLQEIKKGGVVEQSAVKECISVKEPVGVHSNGSSLFVVPSDEYSISYALYYGNDYMKSQVFNMTVNTENFESEIAPCRTFCLEEEAAQLKAKGLGKGANYDNTLVIGRKGVISNKVRFDDEFARHKVLDLIGDLYLIGKPIKGHVFAFKSGHELNISLVKRILKQDKHYYDREDAPKAVIGDSDQLDIHQIMKILPHRHPFLLVDRIIKLEKGKKAVGIKNVTINESFFSGHFPTRPVMPGVLMVEALAQTGGVVVLTNEAHSGKLGLFMAADNVKFRKIVCPGDQLHLEVEVVRDRSRTALVMGQAKVNGEIVVEADLIFSYVDSSFLNS